ncbi:DUF1097 family protein [Paraburkholderia sp. MM5482-R1]|uniref:DUF1097 family protein n=1 Tax=unclassified Paraburkholderia TaxID=2615204 RepID=UPI003D1F52FC
MKLRFSINFGIWVGITAGAYVWLYLVSPLAAFGVLPCTFVAVPIFINAGAKLEQIPNHMTSAVAGVLWGLVYLKVSSFIISAHISPPVALAITVLVVTAVLVAIHVSVKLYGLFSNIPQMFGGIACSFLVGGDKWPYVMLTLCLGVVLGYINFSGLKFLDEDGRWLIHRNKIKRTAF